MVTESRAVEAISASLRPLPPLLLTPRPPLPQIPLTPLPLQALPLPLTKLDPLHCLLFLFTNLKCGFLGLRRRKFNGDEWITGAVQISWQIEITPHGGSSNDRILFTIFSN